jgi:hypothetical protein
MAKKTGKEIVDALTRQIMRARADTKKLDFRDSTGDYRAGTAMHTLIAMQHLAVVLRTLIDDLSVPDRPARGRRQDRTDHPRTAG